MIPTTDLLDVSFIPLLPRRESQRLADMAQRIGLHVVLPEADLGTQRAVTRALVAEYVRAAREEAEDLAMVAAADAEELFVVAFRVLLQGRLGRDCPPVCEVGVWPDAVPLDEGMPLPRVLVVHLAAVFAKAAGLVVASELKSRRAAAQRVAGSS